MVTAPKSDTSRKFSAELMAIRDRWHCKNHPFYVGWGDGTIPLEALGYCMIQHARHVLTLLPHYGEVFLRSVHQPDTAHCILENLAEEMGVLGGGSGEREAVHHNELILRFTRACGYNDEAFAAVPHLPAWQSRTNFYIRVIHEEAPAVFMAMLASLESQEVGQHFERTVPGLTRHHGFAVDDPAIQFFTEHSVADVEHGNRYLAIADKYITDAAERSRVLAIAENSCKLKWFAFNELYELKVKKTKPILPAGVAKYD